MQSEENGTSLGAVFLSGESFLSGAVAAQEFPHESSVSGSSGVAGLVHVAILIRAKR